MKSLYWMVESIDPFLFQGIIFRVYVSTFPEFVVVTVNELVLLRYFFVSGVFARICS